MIFGKLICNKSFHQGEIDRRIYGSFAEHMGRVIYSGIYEPTHPKADEDGFRTDVLSAVRDMGVSCVRYPGGNYVSFYNWQDGVGPVQTRPSRLELAWRSIETNEFGTNEFMRWAKKANVQPMLTVNLGSRSMEDAISYLEYMNVPGRTQYSELRKEHGSTAPYDVKLWCLGNEMDGTWQIGHKTADEYGRLAAEVGKAMKLVDPSIQLVACGSSKSDMPTHPDWDMTVLEHVYGIADYLSLHQYYGGQQMGSAAFLAQSMDFEDYIHTVRSAISVVKKKARSRREMRVSIDEWGVWSVPCDAVTGEIDAQPWQIAPAISEQIYTMEDALLFASMLMAMARNADIVKIGCQSLITNISACLMTERNGGMWKQTIYYPFHYLARYAQGIVLQAQRDIPVYACGQDAVPYLDTLLVWNQQAGELALFVVNRADNSRAQLDCRLEGFEVQSVIESVVLSSADRKQTNQLNHDTVTPRACGNAIVKDNALTAEFEPLSFHMIRLKV